MQAYGTLTIVDLLDMATYIYYADDAEGTNPSASPADKLYIGIYSGKSLSVRPESPDPSWSSDVWSGWQKYIGEDGEDGATIIDFKIEYAQSDNGTQAPGPDGGWSEEVPNVEKGKFLWTKATTYYSKGKPTSTYSVSYIGEDGESYIIESTQEEILKFYDNALEQWVYSPNELSFSVFKDGNLIYFNDGKYKCDIQVFAYSETMAQEFITVGEGLIHKNDSNSSVSIQFSEILSDINGAKGNIKSALESETFLMRFVLQENNKNIAFKVLPGRFGLSNDMATFMMNAQGITQAIQGTKLIFSADGLVLDGGFLTIKKSDRDGQIGEEIFVVDNEGLKLTGIVNATGGYFKNGFFENVQISGELVSATGKIGGFIIDKDSNLHTEDNSIILDGKNSKIFANNIQLGTGAEITNYIRFPYYFQSDDDEKQDGKTYYVFNGSSYEIYEEESFENDGIYYEEGEPSFIYNPALNNGNFIQAGGINISSNGVANFGQIKVDGKNSKIYAENSFSITPTLAKFENIEANGIIGGTITSSVFEYSTVQAVGSTMMFMPSYKITAKDGGYETDKPIDAAKDDLVWIVTEDNKYVLRKITEITDRVIKFEETESITNPFSLLLIGNPENKPLIMGINSGEASVADGHVLGRGLTISEYTQSQGAIEPVSDSILTIPKIKVYLGDLSTIDGNYQGYGLYSDNVYLRGSLTTESAQGSYAGVNTLNGVQATVFSSDSYIRPTPNEEDTSNIIFWAGSNSAAADDIKEAYFQVTEKGSVFAQRAKLTDSLLAGGTIEGTNIVGTSIYGADIYAARIHGHDGTNDAGLTIYDTDKGISFKKKEGDIETLSIGQQGLTSKNNFIISINDNGYADFSAKADGQVVKLEGNGIGVYINQDGVDSLNSQLKASSEDFSILFSNEEVVTFGPSKASFAEDVSINGELWLGQSMQYKKSEDGQGYDLYVF